MKRPGKNYMQKTRLKLDQIRDCWRHLVYTARIK